MSGYSLGTMSGYNHGTNLNNMSSGYTVSKKVYSSGGVSGGLCLSRVHEKQELQSLNDRLSHYIKHVQELRQGGSTMDFSAFAESIQVLENELVSLKAMYEAELQKARVEIEEVSRGKNAFALEMNQTKSMVSEMESRLTMESGKVHKLESEMSNLQMILMQRTRELEEARLSMQRYVQELEQFRMQYGSSVSEVTTWKSRFEKETHSRQELEGRIHQLQQKLEFQISLTAKAELDLSERMNAAKATIIALEAKLHEMSHASGGGSGGSFVMIELGKVKEAAELELKEYKFESEKLFTSSISEIRIQLEQTASRLQEAINLNATLKIRIGEFTTTVTSQEGQITSLQSQLQSLIAVLNQERLTAQESVKKLESQLLTLQDTMMVKMQEVTASREVNLPLKAEIEAFKVILGQEEKRLKIAEKCGFNSCMTGMSGTGFSNSWTSGQISSGFVNGKGPMPYIKPLPPTGGGLTGYIAGSYGSTGYTAGGYGSTGYTATGSTGYVGGGYGSTGYIAGGHGSTGYIGGRRPDGWRGAGAPLLEEKPNRGYLVPDRGAAAAVPYGEKPDGFLAWEAQGETAKQREVKVKQPSKSKGVALPSVTRGAKSCSYGTNKSVAGVPHYSGPPGNRVCRSSTVQKQRI